MKIKPSMVVLSVIVVSLFSVPGAVFAAPASPDSVPATEQLSFSPLVYLTALLAAVTLASLVFSIVVLVRYKAQKEMVCHNYACASNPRMLQESNDHFDYSQLETPEELNGSYSEQSELVMQEAIQRLTAQVAVGATAPSATTHRVVPPAIVPAVAIVPVGKPAIAEAPGTLPQISEPAFVAAPADLPAVAAAPVATPHIAKHRRIPSQTLSAPVSYIKLVPALKHAKKRSVSPLPPVSPRPYPASALEVPQELEYLLRKIG
ncbi:MAG: hypothetical protein LBJ48_00725 [Coriobacteriales bacterium]|nr:hypothetical protein [Coriobacteriales bacterium]